MHICTFHEKKSTFAATVHWTVAALLQKRVKTKVNPNRGLFYSACDLNYQTKEYVLYILMFSSDSPFGCKRGVPSFLWVPLPSLFFFLGKRIDAFHNHNHMWYYFEFFMYRIHTHELHFIVGPRDSYDRFCITPICLACQWYINLTLLLVSMLDDVTSQSGGPSQSGVLYVINMDFEMVNATVNFLKVLIRML